MFEDIRGGDHVETAVGERGFLGVHDPGLLKAPFVTQGDALLADVDPTDVAVTGGVELLDQHAAGTSDLEDAARPVGVRGDGEGTHDMAAFDKPPMDFLGAVVVLFVLGLHARAGR